MYLRMRWHACYAAQPYGLNAESIARPEHRTDVIHTAYIVKNYNKRQLFRIFELVDRQAVHLCYTQLTHNFIKR